MKRCGYRPGLCSNPGVCDLSPVENGKLVKWGKMQEAADSCRYYVMLAGNRQMAFNLPPIRPGWKERK